MFIEKNPTLFLGELRRSLGYNKAWRQTKYSSLLERAASPARHLSSVHLSNKGKQLITSKLPELLGILALTTWYNPFLLLNKSIQPLLAISINQEEQDWVETQHGHGSKASLWMATFLKHRRLTGKSQNAVLPLWQAAASVLLLLLRECAQDSETYKI